MTRLQQFEAHAKHPMLGKLYAKLPERDREACRQFILAHDGLSANEFAHAVNRWFLGKPLPKHHSTMWALVLQSNGGSLLTIQKRS